MFPSGDIDVDMYTTVEIQLRSFAYARGNGAQYNVIAASLYD